LNFGLNFVQTSFAPFAVLGCGQDAFSVFLPRIIVKQTICETRHPRLLPQQDRDVLFQLIQLLFLEAIIDLANATALIDKGQELRMQELLVNIDRIVLRIVQQITRARKMIETVFPARKKEPFPRIGAERVRVMFHPGHTIRLGIDGIRKDAKFRLVRKVAGNLFHIPVEFWTDASAGGEKVFGHIDLPLQIPVRDKMPVLITEREGRDITQYRKRRSAKARDEGRKGKIKPDKQHDEEPRQEKDLFLVHMRKVSIVRANNICNDAANVVGLSPMFTKINLDALGATASVLCAIHCAILPLMLASLPVFGVNIVHNAPFEYGMIGLAFVIGSGVPGRAHLGSGCRRELSGLRRP
jgi:hypothetical protein